MFQRVLFVFLMFSFLAVEISSAQESEKSVFDLDEVVITATRIPKKVRDVSATVSVITREEIEASNATSVMDILGSLNGVFVKKQDAFGRADINIRGLGQNGRRLGVLIDGRPEKMAIFGCAVTHSLPLDNVERIEVVRGPASVLYGSESQGAVINIITKKASKFETDATTSYGNYNTQQYLLRHGGRIDKFNYYFTAGRKLSDGHRKDGDSDYNSHDYTGKLGYDFKENLGLTFSGKYFRGKKYNPGPVDKPLLGLPPDDYERMAFDLTGNAKFASLDGSLKLYNNYGHHQLSDGWHSKDWTYGASLQVDAKLMEGNTATFGFDLRHLTGKRLSGEEGEWNKTEYAPYIHDEQTLLDKLIVTLGARLNVDSVYGVEPCPHFGAVYHLDKDTILRTAVNKGFRSPQINELYVFPPSHEDLEPERVWNFEGGIDRNIVNWLSFDAVAYRMKGSNLIETTLNPNPPPQFKFQNTGEFDFYGAEIGVDIHPGMGFAGTLNYSYLNTGEQTSGRPEDKFDITLRYKYQKFSAWLFGQYVMDLYAADEHKEPMDNYLVVNTKLSYQILQQLRAFVAVDNVLNTEYEIEKGYPMPGRTFTVGLTTMF